MKTFSVCVLSFAATLAACNEPRTANSEVDNTGDCPFLTSITYRISLEAAKLAWVEAQLASVASGSPVSAPFEPGGQEPSGSDSETLSQRFDEEIAAAIAGAKGADSLGGTAKVYLEAVRRDLGSNAVDSGCAIKEVAAATAVTERLQFAKNFWQLKATTPALIIPKKPN